MSEQIVIIGGGPSGLSAAHTFAERGARAVVIEREDRPGGLCRSFESHGATFDIGIHISFTRDEHVRELFAASTPYRENEVESVNWKRGTWVRSPAQNNLMPLPTEEKIKIIAGFANRQPNDDPRDYDEWLRASFGDYFAENYPTLYTRKYWTVEPRQLETKWVGSRIYRPTIEEVLRGAFEADTPNVYYAKEARYPMRGGYESFIAKLEDSADVRCSASIASIDLDDRLIRFADGTAMGFDALVIAAPLPEVVPLISSAPDDVRDAAAALDHTSLLLVSLALRRPHRKPYSYPTGYFYVYDEEILPCRVWSTDEFFDREGDGCYALQAEIFYSRHKSLPAPPKELASRTVSQLASMGVIDEDDVVWCDARSEKYANVIFGHDIYRNRSTVHDWLASRGIAWAGRFGEWGYLWSDQSVLSGKRAAESVMERAR